MSGPTIKALSLHQPWASLIALGAKTIETRGWAAPGHVVGDLVAIHAAKSTTSIGPRGYTLGVGTYEVEHDEGGLLLRGDGLAWPYRLPLGAIVAVARLGTCERMTGESISTVSAEEKPFGFYEPGRFAWHLEAVRRLDDPVPYRGAQGLFNVPLSLVGGQAMTEVQP